jgi:hypothetical protein
MNNNDEEEVKEPYHDDGSSNRIDMPEDEASLLALVGLLLKAGYEVLVYKGDNIGYIVRYTHPEWTNLNFKLMEY